MSAPGPGPSGPDGAAGAVVVDVPEAQRYEVRVDGVLVGLAQYRLEPGRVVFTHTEVDQDRRGGGLAGRLVHAALDDVRRRGLTVVPRCRYVAAWIERHPEYADLLA